MSVGWHGHEADRQRARPRNPMAVVLLGEDRLFADAVRMVLEDAGFSIPRPLGSPQDAIVVVDDVRPDIVLVEVDTQHGVSVGGRVARERPWTKVVALADLDDRRLVERCLRLGFSGYVTKSLETRQFVRSIETIADGHLVMPGPGADVLTDEGDGPLAVLTTREREVLTLLARGETSARIAGELSVSEHTVRTHMQNIFAKLGVRSRVQAAAIAVKRGVR